MKPSKQENQNKNKSHTLLEHKAGRVMSRRTSKIQVSRNKYKPIYWVTRDASGNQKLKRELQKRENCHVECLNLFAYHFVKPSAKSLQALTASHIVVVTSERSVKFFKQALRTYNMRLPRGVTFVAIGAVTQKCVKTIFRRDCLVLSAHATARDLALGMNKFFKTPQMIFMPVAKDARTEFLEVLSSQHRCHRVVVYEKKSCPFSRQKKEKLSLQQPHKIYFYSPSAVDFFADLWTKRELEQFLRGAVLVALGATTAQHLQAKWGNRSVVVEKVK